MWTIFKVFIEFVYCFCFMFWFFGHEACGILAPQSGIEPAPLTLEGEVLTTGQPGKSLTFKNKICFLCSQSLVSKRALGLADNLFSFYLFTAYLKTIILHSTALTPLSENLCNNFYYSFSFCCGYRKNELRELYLRL